MKLLLPSLALAISPTRHHAFLHHHEEVVSHPAPVVSQADLAKLLAVKNKIAQTPGAVDSFDATAFDSVIASIRATTHTNVDAEKAALSADIVGAANAMGKCLDDNACSYDSPKLQALKDEHTECVGTAAHETTEQGETAQACSKATAKCGQRDAAAQALHSEMMGETRACKPQEGPIATGANFEFAHVDTFAQSLLSKHGEWTTLQMECVQAEADCAREQLEDVAAAEERIRACGELTTLEATYKGEYKTCYTGAAGTFDAKLDYSEIVEGWKVALNQLETLICYIKVGSAHLAGDSAAALPTPTVACAGPDNAFACTCSNPGEPGAAYTHTYDLTIEDVTRPAEYEVCSATEHNTAESVKAELFNLPDLVHGKCVPGYWEQTGQILGFGTMNGIVTTSPTKVEGCDREYARCVAQCAELCTSKQGCASFEYVPPINPNDGNFCSINSEANPNTAAVFVWSGVVQIFCTKDAHSGMVKVNAAA